MIRTSFIFSVREGVQKTLKIVNHCISYEKKEKIFKTKDKISFKA